MSKRKVTNKSKQSSEGDMEELPSEFPVKGETEYDNDDVFIQTEGASISGNELTNIESRLRTLEVSVSPQHSVQQSMNILISRMSALEALLQQRLPISSFR